ncbi:CHAT domain-containing protein [Flammeovirga yaeyamensis]|uniref:CHAT domain-containing protein n=1 Tax=Flammeovirga yaeyamensis TaxID=367791 RepID=A0AAX1N8B7_9BACT|nr:CHAT domain-containing tetratricopeptide repeat protein [Flammeovirga yaeyamensis]MBB3698839.1 CHAT domain-containing protein [Flammeovirga yaeyamensis]NMF37424.1 CHAT domain-containing protein [Flammeovirga yaeyamensis]QWG03763.1 CHAT domain-containing protein [Flammeovirga yaeyamensis]
MKKGITILFFLISSTLLAQTKLDSAKLLYEYGQLNKALSVLSSIDDDNLLNQKTALEGKVLGKQNLYTKAYQILDRDVDINDVTYLNVINTKAYLLQNEGFPAESIQILIKGYRQFESFKKDLALSEMFIECLSLLGTAYWQIGENNKAEDYLNQALVLSRSSKDPVVQANCLVNIGLCHSNDDTFKAQVNYEKALESYLKVYPDENHPTIASIYINLGILLQKNFFLDKAIEVFEKASDIWANTFGDDHPNVAFTYIFIADAYLKKGQADLANEYYGFALELYQNVFGEKHPEIANIYIKKGDLFFDSGDFKSALELYQKALIANNQSFNSISKNDFPDLNNYYNPFINLIALQKKASTLEKIHYSKSLNPHDLAIGIQGLELAHQLTKKIRGNQKSEEDKLRLSEITNKIYANGIRLSLALSEASLSKNKWKSKAFDFMEWSKSASLQEAIQESHAKTFAGIPSDIVEQEDKLKDDITALEKDIINAVNLTERDSLRELLINAEYELEIFIKNLEAEFPEYFALKYSDQTITLKEVQKALPKNTALVSYFISDAEELLYIFLVTGGKLYLYTETFDNEFKDEIVSLQTGLKFNFDEIIKMSSVYLTDRLLPFNFNKNISKVLFIPDGKINNIPLDILYSYSINEDSDIKDLPYLAKDYAVSYNFSSTIALSQMNNEMEYQHTLACFAPVNFLDSLGNNEFDPLTGTLSEVNEIKTITKSNGWETSNYVYENAKIELLKDESIQNCSYLHFATHGVVNEENPNQSFIYLLNDNHENLLYTSDIYNLKLKARLVTLSACETGLGKVSKGEGLIGLSRSLKFAGVENSLVSLWTINDVSTALFMQYFYQELAKSDDISLSLQKAKIKLFQGGIYTSPYYWAAFSLIGQ